MRLTNNELIWKTVLIITIAQVSCLEYFIMRNSISVPQNSNSPSLHFPGCDGNGNRFSSVEDCVNMCGGSEPLIDLGCSSVTCDQHEVNINRAKGCTPVTLPGECCPSSWDCSAWDQRLADRSMCYYSHAGEPVGKGAPPIIMLSCSNFLCL